MLLKYSLCQNQPNCFKLSHDASFYITPLWYLVAVASMGTMSLPYDAGAIVLTWCTVAEPGFKGLSALVGLGLCSAAFDRSHKQVFLVASRRDGYA